MKRMLKRVVMDQGSPSQIASNIRGDVTGIWGFMTGVIGDLDLCEITAADRAKGIDISDLFIEGDK